MARSRSFFDDVKNHLECSVCQEQFSEINEPKILKCLHTFCKTCMEAWLRQQREGELSCPTCRQITECPNNIQSLPSNLFCKQLVEIVEAYSGQGQEDSPHCGICDEKKPLKFYCSDCNSFLCDDCISAHKKGKIFRGHHVKEIGNFESSDVQDYARRANFCKKHNDEMRFYCERCQICICRDCAILEHQDHNKISLDQGLEKNKSEIEINVREVQENCARLRSYQDTLEKRRVRVNGSIEEATKEVKRVAERCILLIRQHEAIVTERLVEQKTAIQDAFDTQMTSLGVKLMEMDNTLAFCEEVLLRKNLPEVLNVKATIKQRLQEMSVPFEFMPKLGCSGVKYVPNDVSFVSLLNDAAGKLLTTDTEPSLSVAEGRSLTEGLVGEDCSFTVITKDSAGQTTYSEIDELNVKITSSSQHKDNIKTVVVDLKDGRYSISYRPTTPGEFTVSIEVEGNQIMESPFKLKVSTRNQYPKQEWSMSDNSYASIKQVPQSTALSAASQEREDDGSSPLHDEDKNQEEVHRNRPAMTAAIEATNYIPEKPAFLLPVPQSTALSAASQEREDDGSSPLHDEDKNQEEVNRNRPAMTAAIEATNYPPERSNGDTHGDRKASSPSLEILSFEIESKIAKVFVKAYNKELEDIENKYHVEITRDPKESKFCLKPKDECSVNDYEEACDQFITLCQKMYEVMKIERISLKSLTQFFLACQALSIISKNFPISVQACKNQSQCQWEISGEASNIEEALKYLEEQGVGINREKEDTEDETGRRKQGKDDEEVTFSRGEKNPGNKLETFLDLPAGKVKVSVYKGDITNERVDAIVNPANGDLQHDGGIAKVILDKGGKIIEEESRAIIKKRGVLKYGEAVATKSGNLPCKAIVHAVGPRWDEAGSTSSKMILRRACVNSFIETEKLNMTSIALPAIGCGTYGMPKYVCAEVMLDAVDEFVRQGGVKTKTITDIRFVNIDDPSVQAFRRELYTRYAAGIKTD